MNKLNIFAQIPGDLKEEFFEDIVSQDGLKIEKIVSRGHKTTQFDWYDQDTNEWVVLLQGEAILSFENEDDVRLETGDYINILAHKKHKVSWTKPDFNTIWLAVHYS